MFEVDIQNVIECIYKLDTNKAVGVDGISQNLFKPLLIVWPYFLQSLLTRVFCHPFS